MRSAEHLLHLSQRSRATLGALGDRCRQLAALHAALLTLAAPGEGGGEAATVPPQARCWAWYQQQRGALAALVQQADESAELLRSAAAAETAAAPRKQLQAGAQQACDAAAALRQCSSRLGVASEAAVPLPAQDGGSSDGSAAPLFLPAGVLAALQANSEALSVLQQQLAAGAAAQQQEAESEQAALPSLPELAAAVAAAARDSAAAQATLHTGVEAASAPQQEALQQLAGSLEAAVAAALVWAQNAKPAEPAAAEGGEEPPQAEQPPLPALLQQLEQQLCLHKASELGSHAAAVLAALASASDLPPSAAAAEQQRQAAAAAAGLAPLLGLLLAALRALGLQYLALHRSASKLAYIAASLFGGLVQEGFCMPEGADGERCAWGDPAAAGRPGVCLRHAATTKPALHRCCALTPAHPPSTHPAGEAEEGGEVKETEGTGLGEGDTTGAKDISNEVRGERGARGCWVLGAAGSWVPGAG